MKLVVGLGNPGQEYERTRHNVGFMALETLFERMTNDKLPITNQGQRSNFKFQSKFEAEVARSGEVILVKPQTFMNRSGEAVRKVVDYYRIDPQDIWVVHDDLDIKLGEYKIQLGKGPKVHNGVTSVEQTLGTKDFWRVRVGTDNRDKRQETRDMSGEDYVLQPFLREEQPIIEGVINILAKEVYGRLI